MITDRLLAAFPPFDPGRLVNMVLEGAILLASVWWAAKKGLEANRRRDLERLKLDRTLLPLEQILRAAWYVGWLCRNTIAGVGAAGVTDGVVRNLCASIIDAVQKLWSPPEHDMTYLSDEDATRYVQLASAALELNRPASELRDDARSEKCKAALTQAYESFEREYKEFRTFVHGKLEAAGRDPNRSGADSW